MGQHRLLSAAGQELRSGRQGCRTTVKFDDERMRMVLDYKIGENPWKRLCAEEASQAISKGPGQTSIQETSAEDFRGLLRPASGANAITLDQ